ncbi:hypothetical protein VN97_g12049 [Penicillium thymicola]|uniref:Uncharacterized protein n=1 Tax=Penicillium thymicola TaxID=293382 RepID=A0AAI9T720_PENTH|nr:hypothetical protein VN97_g12049 [Penicillium thymicola]
MIEDDDALLGSEFNPIVIHKEDYGYFEDEQLNSDTDTDIIATPEFWWDKLFFESRDLLVDEDTNMTLRFWLHQSPGGTC